MKTLLLNAGFVLWLLSCSLHAAAQSFDNVRQGLLEDIQMAQAGLSASERSVGEQRQVLSAQINRVQNTVLDLRARTVAARRLADEDTLSLGQIENRLAEWQNQSVFQKRVLAGFLTRLPGAGEGAAGSNGDLQRDVQLLRAYTQTLRGRLYPAWQSSEIVLPDGRIAPAEILQAGPVLWYAHAEESGLAADESGALPRVALPMSGPPLLALQALKNSGSGGVTFDPTLSQTTLAIVPREGLIEHVRKGGIWVIPILGFALFATLIAVLKALALARLPKQQPALAERLELAIANGTATQFTSLLKGCQAELAAITLQASTAQQREERLYALLLDTRSHLDKWLGAIALTAAVAPLLGLLGTVSGMITTFKLMTLFGAGDATSVSAGISEALVTTELGLVVAIPALVAHALMSRKVKSYYAQLETAAIRLSQIALSSR